jgi:hypothetical protein
MSLWEMTVMPSRQLGAALPNRVEASVTTRMCGGWPGPGIA